MLNIGPGEVLVILVIALVVLGPSRLPATARTMGRVLAKTRHLVRKFQEEMQAAADAPLEALARERGRSESPKGVAERATSSDSTDGAPRESDDEPAGPAGEPNPDPRGS